MCTKEEDISLMERIKKGRKPLSTKKDEFNKYFDKSKAWCCYSQKEGHYAREFYAKKKNKEKFHVSTIVDEYEPSLKKSAEEKDDNRHEYFL